MKITTPGPVVMVDDNAPDIVLAEDCFELSKLDNQWLSFPNGERFLEYLTEVEAGSAVMPALVLLDINMPRLSGHEVLERVRTNPFFHALPVFCMLTSSSAPRDKSRAETLGASGFVVKPDDPDLYIELFDRLAS